MSSWSGLAAELGEWRAAARAAEFWWRDDDAASLTPELRQLLSLSGRTRVALALAVIPERAESDAVSAAECVILHGCDHRNRAPDGGKKTEFPPFESDDAALERLARARARLASLAGPRFLPVLAPPWNRLRAGLIPRLPEAGIRGLSRYGARGAATPGVHEANTHVDLIAWRGDRGFVGEHAALRLVVEHLRQKRGGAADAAEPTGILTHHALHDREAWRFLERLFDETRASGAKWRAPGEVFPSAP